MSPVPREEIAHVVQRSDLDVDGRPLIGDLVSHSKSHAYSYLPRSVGSWHTPETLRHLMEEAGLRDVKTRRLSMGIAVIHTAKKVTR